MSGMAAPWGNVDLLTCSPRCPLLDRGRSREISGFSSIRSLTAGTTASLARARNVSTSPKELKHLTTQTSAKPDSSYPYRLFM